MGGVSVDARKPTSLRLALLSLVALSPHYEQWPGRKPPSGTCNLTMD